MPQLSRVVLGVFLVAVVVVLALAALSRAASRQPRWTVQRVCTYTTLYRVSLNERGEVSWTEQTSPQFSMGFVWQKRKTIKLGSGEASANGLNDRGQVIGWSDRVAGGGFVWRTGKFVSLLGSHRGNTIPTAINSMGAVVGAVEGTSAGRWFQHAFLWRNGKLRDLGSLGGLDTVAEAINGRGEVVGTASTKSDGFLMYLWRGGKLTKLLTPGWSDLLPLGITERGEVFGTARGQAPHHASGETKFLWQRGTMIDLAVLGGRRSDASAINKDGKIVGWFETSAGDRHAFLWQTGILRDLGTLGGTRSEALAINDRSQVVGTSTLPNGATHAFLWREGRMTDLGTLVPKAINDHGQILGRAGKNLVLWTPRS